MPLPIITGGKGGQISVKRETAETEVLVPWRQAKFLAGALAFFWLGISTPLLFFGVQISLVTLIMLASGIVWYSVLTPIVYWMIIQKVSAPFVRLVSVCVLCVEFLVFGGVWKFFLWGWVGAIIGGILEKHGFVKTWAMVGIFLTVCIPALVVAYRYIVEIWDPNGPTAPRNSMYHLGPVFPWTKEPKVPPKQDVTYKVELGVKKE